jgi:hypothetical protein
VAVLLEEQPLKDQGPLLSILGITEPLAGKRRHSPIAARTRLPALASIPDMAAMGRKDFVCSPPPSLLDLNNLCNGSKGLVDRRTIWE